MKTAAKLVTTLIAVGALLSMQTAKAQAGKTVQTVFVIDMENHNFTQPSSVTSPQQILKNPAAPYINSLITPGNKNAKEVSYASNYHNVLVSPKTGLEEVSVHPSEPNYLWQEAGTNFDIFNDNDPYDFYLDANGEYIDNVQSTNQHLTGLLQKAGISWKTYQEDIDLAPGTSGFTGTVLPQNQWIVPLASFSGTSTSYTNPYNGSNQYNFACKHDGTLFFTDTNGNGNASFLNHEVSHYAPLQQLATDLANNTVAAYNLITPDQYNDMHTALNGGFTYNGVTYTGDAANIAQGDNFLSIVIPQIMKSKAYKNNGAIVIWWDETEGGDDLSYALTEIVISPLAKGNAYNSTVFYTHSSDLKTMQKIFGVYTKNNEFLGDANTTGTHDLSDLFQSGAIPN